MPGRFIALEGGDGCGKSTQAPLLAEALGARLTREPGGTWLGERLREVLLARTESGAAPTDPLTDALLFNAARRQLVREVIVPALDADTTVLCARYADSTLAYQGFGAGVDLGVLRDLAEVATDGLQPDLTLVLDVPVEVGLARKSPGDVTRFEQEFMSEIKARHSDVLASIRSARELTPDIEKRLQDVLADFVKKFA